MLSIWQCQDWHWLAHDSKAFLPLNSQKDLCDKTSSEHKKRFLWINTWEREEKKTAFFSMINKGAPLSFSLLSQIEKYLFQVAFLYSISSDERSEKQFVLSRKLSVDRRQNLCTRSFLTNISIRIFRRNTYQWFWFKYKQTINFLVYIKWKIVMKFFFK